MSLPSDLNIEKTGGSLSFNLITEPTLLKTTLSVVPSRCLEASHLIVHQQQCCTPFLKSASLSRILKSGAQKSNASHFLQSVSLLFTLAIVGVGLVEDDPRNFLANSLSTIKSQTLMSIYASLG
jgi:hypothetical protein